MRFFEWMAAANCVFLNVFYGFILKGEQDKQDFHGRFAVF